ncbi:MAG: hypothetical protein OZX49_02199 [Immundisolibacter sp.]|nr:hypothetical protein [Immundisolibacter sp.]
MPRGRVIAQRQPLSNFLHEAGIDTRRGQRNNLHLAAIDDAYPGHAKPAVLDGDAARLPEQLVPVAHAHDQRIDAAEHCVHAVQAADSVIRFLAYGDVRGETCDAYNPAGGIADRKASGLDPPNQSIRAHDPVLEIEPPLRNPFLVFLVDRCPLIRADRLGPRFSIGVRAFAAAAKYLRVGGTDIQRAAVVGVDQEEHVANVFRHLPKAQLAGMQVFFGLSACRHVHVHDHGAIWTVIRQGRHRHQEPALHRWRMTGILGREALQRATQH